MNETGGIMDRNFYAYATDMDNALLRNKNKNLTYIIQCIYL